MHLETLSIRSFGVDALVGRNGESFVHCLVVESLSLSVRKKEALRKDVFVLHPVPALKQVIVSFCRVLLDQRDLAVLSREEELCIVKD